jgi:diguanylate cyclase (GGDEF)-like protein
LLVEDDPHDTLSIEELITAAIGPGVDLVHTPRLADAFERLNNQYFDAVLLSLETGAAESVRRALEYTHAPIIVLTSGANDSLGIQALQAGADDYLVKQTLDRDTLSRAIQRAIARNVWKSEIYAASFIDDLTSLYNRRGFMTLGEQQLKFARRAGAGVNLAFADLDGLKFINDHFGHSEGDRVLKDITGILKATFHRESDLLARVGGDEFAVLWIAYEPFPADAVRTRLKTALNSYLALKEPPYPVSLSIGLCQYPADFSEPLTEMLSEGDQRMYEEKRGRRKAHIA